ncbi:MAG: hypothetical protein ACYDDI_15640 [Candidatus Acidiferrales bacterium]
MAEASQIVFSYKEIAEALVKKQGLHEGVWGLFVKFGMQATNIGPNENDLKPAAVIPILELGLQKFEKENNLSVDAAKISSRARSK